MKVLVTAAEFSLSLFLEGNFLFCRFSLTILYSWVVTREMFQNSFLKVSHSCFHVPFTGTSKLNYWTFPASSKKYLIRLLFSSSFFASISSSVIAFLYIFYTKNRSLRISHGNYNFKAFFFSLIKEKVQRKSCKRCILRI